MSSHITKCQKPQAPLATLSPKLLGTPLKGASILSTIHLERLDGTLLKALTSAGVLSWLATMEQKALALDPPLREDALEHLRWTFQSLSLEPQRGLRVLKRWRAVGEDVQTELLRVMGALRPRVLAQAREAALLAGQSFFSPEEVQQLLCVAAWEDLWPHLLREAKRACGLLPRATSGAQDTSKIQDKLWRGLEARQEERARRLNLVRLSPQGSGVIISLQEWLLEDPWHAPNLSHKRQQVLLRRFTEERALELLNHDNPLAAEQRLLLVSFIKGEVSVVGVGESRELLLHMLLATPSEATRGVLQALQYLAQESYRVVFDDAMNARLRKAALAHEKLYPNVQDRIVSRLSKQTLQELLEVLSTPENLALHQELPPAAWEKRALRCCQELWAATLEGLPQAD